MGFQPHLSRLQYGTCSKLNHGRDLYHALREAHRNVGLAMVLTNLALISGFMELVFSSLIPAIHFGVLVSVALFGGLVGNLVILPMNLGFLYGQRLSNR